MFSSLLRQLGPALRAMIVLTVLLGLAYPLLLTGFAQVAFHDKANGSLVTDHGRPVGSSLIGQSFDRAPQYFQARPSAAGNGYDPLASGASNLGPSSRVLLTSIQERRAAAAKLNGTPPNEVAPDALEASGSGLDPDISPLYAAQQVDRVARVRGLSVAVVRSLVDRYTSGRTLGFLGEPHVNVLLLNLALDRASDAAD